MNPFIVFIALVSLLVVPADARDERPMESGELVSLAAGEVINKDYFAAGILAMTVVGIPLALIVTAIYLVSIYLVRVFVIFRAGSALFEWAARPVREVWAFAIGLVIYFLLTLIPFIGGIVTLFVILSGLGAAFLADRDLYFAAGKREAD